MLFSIFDVLRTFEALQIFFYKMGKNWGRFWVQHIPWSSKILFCFWIETYFFIIIIFFEMAKFGTLFRRCPALWKSTFKMTALFRRCITLLHNFVSTVLNVDVDLTLCDVATSYQPKSKVELTLKCLLGYRFCKHFMKILRPGKKGKWRETEIK